MPTTTRYLAFLRGVSPTNLRMPALQQSLEKAGFTNVKTLLSSGNVAFDAVTATPDAIATKVEAAMKKHLGKTFRTIVRPQKALVNLIERDPFAGHKVAADAKPIVTFLPAPLKKKIALPEEVDGARILGVMGGEVLTAYRRSPKGPVFMRLIEKTFGKDVTTRTWDTVKKCAKA